MPGIVPPGSTGVIYVSERAMANGWTAGSDEVRPLPLVLLVRRVLR